MTLTLQATPEDVMRAVEKLEEFSRAAGLPESMIFGFKLSLEECASNIVNHALGRNPQHEFQVSFERTGPEFFIELRDPGPEFDPTAATKRPLRAGDDDAPGGWGIQLVRRYMDAVRYQRRDGENVLRLVKKLA